MSNAITITHSEGDSTGRYEAHVEDRDGTGELTYSRESATRIIADRTVVDPRLRGTGVGKALVEKLVADARRDGFKIAPVCSFIAAQFQRHPEWSDVFES